MYTFISFKDKKLEVWFDQEEFCLLQRPETLVEVCLDVEIHYNWVVLLFLIIQDKSEHIQHCISYHIKVNAIPRMKWNLNNSCSLHSRCLHRRQLDQANIKPEILTGVLVCSNQFVVFHNSSVEEQLIKVAALVKLLQLLVSLHSLTIIEVCVFICLQQTGPHQDGHL